MGPAARLASLGASVATLAAAVCAASAGAVLLSACGSCDSIVRQSALPLIAANSFDGIETDQSAHKVFLADQTSRGIDVVDTSGAAPRYMGTVDVAGSPNGLAFDPDRKRLYAGVDGGTVAAIDADAASPTYLKVVDRITVDTATADLIDYSSQTGSLYVGTGHSANVVVVDTTTDRVTHTFNVKVPVEQPRYDAADGKIYVTTPATNSILQLDSTSGKVTRTYVQAGCRPSGLAINPNRQIALAACRSSTVLFNLRTGLDQINTTVPGGDIVAYDARQDRFTVGSSHGPRDSSVGVFSGDGRFMAQVQSSPNAHGAVLNDATGVAYALSPVGLLSFSPSACAPPPDWLTFAGNLAFFITPLAGFGLFLYLYARRRFGRDPNVPRPPTWEQLQQEDLAAERERIRALEDSIYGPEGG